MQVEQSSRRKESPATAYSHVQEFDPIASGSKSISKQGKIYVLD